MGIETEAMEACGPTPSEDDIGRVDSSEEDSAARGHESEEPIALVQAGESRERLTLVKGDRVTMRLIFKYPAESQIEPVWIDLSAAITTNRVADLNALKRDFGMAAQLVHNEIGKYLDETPSS